mgnify:CR=1 FL=1
MTELKNDHFLKALQRQATPYTPVWMMRQAGRYLPEYRATRQKAGDFLSLCKNPNLATEVTLQPLDRYPLLDASILFSDILTVPDAMGLGLYFAAGEGPKFERPLREESDIQKLKIPDIEKDLKYVIDAVSQIKKALQGRVPLIGFSGSPWTLATYMVEGQGGTDFLTIKKMAYARPDLLHHIFTNFKTLITVEDGAVQGGFGSAIAEFMVDHQYSAKVIRLGIPDQIIEHGEQKELYEQCGIDSKSILTKILAQYPAKAKVLKAIS